MKTNLILATVLCVFLITSCSGNQSTKTEVPVADSAAASPTEYTCPMHPAVISNKPGTCPDCGMELQVKS